MPKPPRSFVWDLIWRFLRFIYLLWGGMLLGSTAVLGNTRIPSALWQWPWFCRFLLGPWGRGLALGLGLVMALAALLEIWELVDRLLGHFFTDTDH